MNKDIIIFNTFSNLQHIKKLPETDILIWTASLIRYKSFGYKTKLFCLKSDLDFLHKYYLDLLYDEIDTTLFENNEKLSKIKNDIFWSSRKIEAIYYQLRLNPYSIYSDVDIIMEKPFSFNDEVIVWCTEMGDYNPYSAYIDWTLLSKPDQYIMPDYIQRERDAYNCGILWFKNFNVFETFYKQYYDFVLGNPGILDESLESDVAFACNAEQRILKAVLSHLKQKVNCIEKDTQTGICVDGIHFFCLRHIWRNIANYQADCNQDFTEEKNKKINLILQQYNNVLLHCLYILTDMPELFEFWFNNEKLYDFINRHKNDKNHIVVREYF